MESAQDMSVTIREVGKAVIVTPQGDIDSLVATHLRSTIESLLERGKVDIFLNLSLVKLIDTAGLNVLLFAFKETKDREGTFKLSNLSDVAEKMMKTTNLDKVLEIYNTEEEALASLRR